MGMKEYLSYILRPGFLLIKNMPLMWTRSYFVATAGNVSNATVQRYCQENTISILRERLIFLIYLLITLDVSSNTSN
jgi:hypothetical protein